MGGRTHPENLQRRRTLNLVGGRSAGAGANHHRSDKKKEGGALRSPSRLQARTDSVRVALLGTGGAWAGAHAPGTQLGALSWAGGPQVPKPTTTDFWEREKRVSV